MLKKTLGVQVNFSKRLLKAAIESPAVPRYGKGQQTKIAEELDVKPAVLNKAINIAYKAEFGKKRDEFDELETILESVGRTL